MKRIALLTALTIGVTAGGIMLGALLVSPGVTALSPRTIELSVAALLLVAGLAVGAQALVGTVQRGRAARSGGRATTSVPLIALGGARGTNRGRPERTPRAVQALAQAGTAPIEIARRTGLPHDAVALLLAIR